MSDDDEETEGLVLKQGSYECQCGYAGDDAPRTIGLMCGGVLPTTNSYEGGKFTVGRDVMDGLQSADPSSVSFPIDGGKIKDWDALEKIWGYYFEKINPRSSNLSKNSLLVVDDLENSLENRERMQEICFESFGLPKFMAVESSVCALYSSGRTTGLVLDMGHSSTRTLAIYQGYGLPDSIKKLNTGGSDIMSFLGTAMQGKPSSYAAMLNCQAVFDDFKKKDSWSTNKLSLPDGTTLPGDILKKAYDHHFFNEESSTGRNNLAGIVKTSLQSCPIDCRSDFFGNILLTGHSAMSYFNIQDKLKSAMKDISPSAIHAKIKVGKPPESRYSAWIGGSIVGSMTSTQHMFVTRKMYDEVGANAVTRFMWTTKEGGSDYLSKFDEEVDKAKDQGMQKFGRGKISLFGDGRMGKTAFARSVKGDPFEQTVSTVGIEENMVEVDLAKIGDGKGDWAAYIKPEKQMEAALAKLMTAMRSDNGGNNSRGGGGSGGGGGDAVAGEYGTTPFDYTLLPPICINEPYLKGEDAKLGWREAMMKHLSVLPVDTEASLAAAKAFNDSYDERKRANSRAREEEERVKKKAEAEEKNRKSLAERMNSRKKKNAVPGAKSTANGGSSILVRVGGVGADSNPGDEASSASSDAAAVAAGQTYYHDDTDNEMGEDEDENEEIAELKGKQLVDDEYLAKYLSDSIHTSSKLSISLLDFGGQKAFSVIHHLFISSYSICALVFSMEWMLSNQEVCLRGLSDWLNSITVHTYDGASSPPSMAPIVFVGTHKDVVTDPKIHEHISTLLYDKFSQSVGWDFLIRNEAGIGQRGTTTLNFFAVDNTLGRNDPTMVDLMDIFEKTLESADYVNEEKPLKWLKCIDELTAKKTSALSLRAVKKIAMSCRIPRDDIPLFLRFMTKMNILLWLEEDALKEVVIFDPIAYFVTPATVIISKLTPTKDDSTTHETEIHQLARRKERDAYDTMIKKGTISNTLIPLLLVKYLDRMTIVVRLMVKFNLIVPIVNITAEGNKNGSKGPGEDGKGERIIELVDEFIAPALLPDIDETTSPLVGDLWTTKQFSSCFIVFSSSAKLHKETVLGGPADDSMHNKGFLPPGLFQRLMARVIAWSQQTSINCSANKLFKTLAIVFFGGQRLRLMVVPMLNCIRLDVEGTKPNVVLERILEQIGAVVQESMKNLQYSTRLQYLPGLVAAGPPTKWIQGGSGGGGGGTGQHYYYISLEAMRESKRVGQGFYSGDVELDSSQVDTLLGSWAVSNELLSAYDVFISYRWNKFDTPLTLAWFDRLSLFNVTTAKRNIEVFLDTKRLQDGRDFRLDFSQALAHSAVVLPLVSAEALQRMTDHNPSTIDNLLVEWILALTLYKLVNLRILPVLLGKMNSETGKRSRFDVNLLKSMPDVKPSETVNTVKSVLKFSGVFVTPEVEQELNTLTVRSVMNDIGTKLYYSPGGAHQSIIVAEGCEKVLVMLNQRLQEMGATTYTPSSSSSSNAHLGGDVARAPEAASPAAAAAAVVSMPIGSAGKDTNRAWEILQSKGKAKDSDALIVLLEDLGYESAADLDLITSDDADSIRALLKPVGVRAFNTALLLE